MLHQSPLIYMIRSLILWMVFFQYASAALPKDDDSQLQQAILYYVNGYRASKNLPPLQLEARASAAAKQHSHEMAVHAIPFGHLYFEKRINALRQHVHGYRGAAENVAYYKLNAKELVRQWIASPGHRQNIVGPYQLTGIGIAHSKQGWAYYTQLFIGTTLRT